MTDQDKAVVEAVRDGTLYAQPALLEHFEADDACARAVLADVMDRGGYLSPEEAALALSGMAEPDAEAHARRVIAQDAEFMAWLAAAEAANTPEPRWSRLWRWLRSPPGLALIASVVIVLGIALTRSGAPDPYRARAFDDQLQAVRIELNGTECVPLGAGAQSACATTARIELAIYFRIERGSAARHLALVARDAAGDVTILRPGKDALPTTPGRSAEGCARGYCPLSTFDFKAPVGELDLIAIFSPQPLDSAILRQMAGRASVRSDHDVERFKLKVE